MRVPQIPGWEFAPDWPVFLFPHRRLPANRGRPIIFLGNFR
jgi:hypothetical protein